MSANPEPWHLDRKIPIGIIVVMLTQLVGGAMILSAMRSEIASNSRDIIRLDAQVEAIRTTAGEQAVQLGRIEENTRATQAAVERLLGKIEGNQ